MSGDGVRSVKRRLVNGRIKYIRRLVFVPSLMLGGERRIQV